MLSLINLSSLLQPTVHFAEEPIIRGGDEDEEEDGEDGDRSDEEDERPPFPMEKQRLIRKDTPHYKKHFRITKLPKAETVAALLQGFSPDGLNSPTRAGEEEDEEDECTPQHHPRMEDLGDSRHHVNSSQVKVKGESVAQKRNMKGNFKNTTKYTCCFLYKLKGCREQMHILYHITMTLFWYQSYIIALILNQNLIRLSYLIHTNS